MTLPRLFADSGSPWGQLAHIACKLGGVQVERSMHTPPPDTPVDRDRVLGLHDPGGSVLEGNEEVLEALDARSTTTLFSHADWETLRWARDEILGPAVTAGHAATKPEYEAAYARLFEALDTLDSRLGGVRFFHGGHRPTGADLWLLCLLVRFDAAYYGLYKCNRTRLQDFAELPGYVRDVFQSFDIADTLDRDRIKTFHHEAEPILNPKGILPKGGGTDLWQPHDRRLRFESDTPDQSGTEEDQNATRRAGEWVRKRSAHRHVITADGASGFLAEPNRYHLYVSNNCPWCHRVSLTRELKGLSDSISLDVLYYRRDPDRGWQFKPEEPGCTPDTLYGHRFIQELYARQGSKEKSVPVLFDRQTETIVSNESAEIIRMLDQAFGKMSSTGLELYPAELSREIDRLNRWTYTEVNNGAYKAGFASTQQAYDAAFDRLFAAFDALDRLLSERTFLAGNRLTEADVRLFPTIYRFDHVYYTRFRLNHRMVRDYRHLERWFAHVLEWPGVQAASNLEHCKRGYFGRTGNNIVPLGPDFTEAASRQ